jgi:hypothetical protein
VALVSLICARVTPSMKFSRLSRDIKARPILWPAGGKVQSASSTKRFSIAIRESASACVISTSAICSPHAFEYPTYFRAARTAPFWPSNRLRLPLAAKDQTPYFRWIPPHASDSSVIRQEARAGMFYATQMSSDRGVRKSPAPPASTRSTNGRASRGSRTARPSARWPNAGRLPLSPPLWHDSCQNEIHI